MGGEGGRGRGDSCGGTPQSLLVVKIHFFFWEGRVGMGNTLVFFFCKMFLGVFLSVYTLFVFMCFVLFLSLLFCYSANASHHLCWGYDKPTQCQSAALPGCGHLKGYSLRE